ncbi:MAG: hypothetical protein ACRCXZ_03490 [Patescibacteria group bacterium]
MNPDKNRSLIENVEFLEWHRSEEAREYKKKYLAMQNILWLGSCKTYAQKEQQFAAAKSIYLMCQEKDGWVKYLFEYSFGSIQNKLLIWDMNIEFKILELYSQLNDISLRLDAIEFDAIEDEECVNLVQQFIAVATELCTVYILDGCLTRRPHQRVVSHFLFGDYWGKIIRSEVKQRVSKKDRKQIFKHLKDFKPNDTSSLMPENVDVFKLMPYCEDPVLM